MSDFKKSKLKSMLASISNLSKNASQTIDLSTDELDANEPMFV
jgi:hypothetical protein